MKIRFVESERFLIVNYSVYFSFYCKGVYHQYHSIAKDYIINIIKDLFSLFSLDGSGGLDLLFLDGRIGLNSLKFVVSD